jgi:hypothetical protein
MNSNKIKIVLPFFFFTLFSFTCIERYESEKINKITFHYVDFEIETPFQISCDNFENSFSDGYNTIVVKEDNNLEEFAGYISHIEVSDSKKIIDVRVKVIITYANKKTSLLCMDRFNNLILNNKSINANQNIIAFIRKQISK